MCTPSPERLKVFAIALFKGLAHVSISSKKALESPVGL